MSVHPLRAIIIALSVVSVSFVPLAFPSTAQAGSTLVSDSFGRPDAASLGTADSGQVWQALAGSVSVAGGLAAMGDGYALATVDAGRAEGIVSATVTQPGTEFWLVIRSSGPGDYWRFGRSSGGAYQLQLVRDNALGNPPVTLLQTVQPAAGDRLECRAGAGLSCSVNGQAVVRTSDASLATATSHGLASWNSTETRLDDFQALELPQVADLTAALSGTRSVTVSGQIALQATVANVGTTAAEGSALAGTLTGGTTLTSVTSTAGTCTVEGGTFRCPIGGLAPGGQARVDILATAPPTPGVVTTTVQASHPGTDGDPASDSAGLTTTVRLPAPPPGTVVRDGFDRPAVGGGTLGTADTGEVWTTHQGAFTIDGGRARAATDATSLATVDAGFAFGTYEVTVTSGADAPFWLAFRVQDAANHYRLGPEPWSGNYALTKVIGGNERPIYARNQRADVRAQNGDVVRIVLRTDDGIFVYVNGELVIDAGDTDLMDNTSFGLRTSSAQTRFDGFQVSSVIEGFPVQDTFTRPDSDSLSTPEQGTRYPWRSWEGWSWGTQAGRAYFPWGGYGLTAIDASTEMAGVKATVSALGGEQWLVFRYAEDGSYYRFGATAGSRYQLQLIRGSEIVPLPVPVEATDPPIVAAGDVVQVVQDLGGLVELKVDGVITHRFTDPTTNARATIYGMATAGQGARFDDFSTALPAPPGGGGGAGGQLLANSGFESGSTGWSQTSGVISKSTNRPARTGSWKAWLNGYGDTHTDTLSQSVTIPAGVTSATLSFWLRIDTTETGSTAYDTLKVQVLNSSGTVLTTLATYSNVAATATYGQQSFSLAPYKGQTVTVRFRGTEDSSLQTSFVIDDTALTTTGVPGGGGGAGGQLLANSGFESGSTGWSQTSGVISKSTNRPARTGSWKAWLNGYGDTHTDTLSQSVTIPAGVTGATLSFWLRIDTTETGSTAYDTLKVQVLNSSGTVLSTLATYSNVGATATYGQQSFSLAPYKGQTVTVRFRGTEDSSLQTSFVIDDTALTTT